LYSGTSAGISNLTGCVDGSAVSAGSGTSGAESVETWMRGSGSGPSGVLAAFGVSAQPVIEFPSRHVRAIKIERRFVKFVNISVILPDLKECHFEFYRQKRVKSGRSEQETRHEKFFVNLGRTGVFTDWLFDYQLRAWNLGVGKNWPGNPLSFDTPVLYAADDAA